MNLQGLLVVLLFQEMDTFLVATIHQESAMQYMALLQYQVEVVLLPELLALLRYQFEMVIMLQELVALLLQLEEAVFSV